MSETDGPGRLMLLKWKYFRNAFSKSSCSLSRITIIFILYLVRFYKAKLTPVLFPTYYSDAEMQKASYHKVWIFQLLFRFAAQQNHRYFVQASRKSL